METLVRLTLDLKGVWTTPWQSDSLLGSLACMWVRFRGAAALQRDFLDPWRANDPPFVLSDAFPGGVLPTPVALPLLWEWPRERRKEIKRCAWLTLGQFRDVQAGKQPDIAPGSNGRMASIKHHIRLRNSVVRGPTESEDASVQLFEVPYSTLDRPERGLTLYARGSRDGLDLLVESLDMLGKVGFGADASVGHGAFQIRGKPVECPELDDIPGANGFISLSTYQPGRADPVDGYWRAFIKYGKTAPEFHDANVIFKRPQVMISPGACFRTPGHPKSFCGHCVGTDHLLAVGDQETLAERGVHPVQAAFALAVPMKWPDQGDGS